MKNRFKKGNHPKTEWKKGYHSPTEWKIEHIPWNKNMKLPPISEKHKEAIRFSAIGNTNTKGKHWKVKDTSKILEANRRRKYPNRKSPLPITELTRSEMREAKRKPLELARRGHF